MTLQALLDGLDGLRLKTYVFDTAFDDGCALLLAASDTQPVPGCVCAAEASALPALLEKVSAEDGVCFFGAGSSAAAERLAVRRRVNLVLADLPLTELHNRLSERLCALRRFRQSCMRNIWKSRVPFDLIASGAAELNAPLFLLSQRLELIYHDGEHTAADPLYDALLRQEALDVRLLPGFDAAALESGPRALRTAGGNIFCIRRVVSNTVQFYLAALLPPAREKDCCSYVLDLVSEYTIIQSERVVRGEADPSHALARLLDSLQENGSLSPEELRVRLKQLEFPIGRFFTTIVVFPDDQRADYPMLAIVNHLRRFFPGQNISVHNNVAVVLLCRDSFFFADDEIDTGRFEALLEKINCSAAVNNTISNWANLLANYKLSLSIMHISLTMNRGSKDPSRRIFRFEEYGTFFIINLCQQALERLGLDDSTLIYIGMPALTTLAIYDSLHDDNLVGVLYQYLLNDKNAIRTGQALYMHRNTVRKKLSIIKDIMHIDIDNPALHFRLLFSCLLLQYYRDYLRKPFLATIENVEDMDSLWPTFPIRL